MNTFDAWHRTGLSRALRRLDRIIRLTGFMLFSWIIATPWPWALAQTTTIPLDLEPIDTTLDPNVELVVDFEIEDPATPPIVVEGCYFPTLIFDRNDNKCSLPFITDPLSSLPVFNGPLSSQAFETAAVALENAAINDILDAHQLPPSDRSHVLSHVRDNVRAFMFTRLLALLKNPTRTPEEQTLVDYFAYHLKMKRLQAAAYSIHQYNGWYYGACNGWNPPPGFEPYNPGATCGGQLGGYFSGGPQPPSYDEFIAYGIALGYDQTNTHPQVAAAAANTARAVGLITAGFAAVGIGTTVTALLSTATLTAISAAVFPHAAATVAAFSTSTYTATSVVAGVGGGATVVGTAVAVAIMAIVIAAIRIAQVIEAEQIPFKLGENFLIVLTQTIDLNTLVDTPQGMQELYAVFIEKTALRDGNPPPVPAPLATDARFLIKDEFGNPIPPAVPVIDFQTWALSLQPQWEARLSGGWFALKFVLEDTEVIETLTLGIPYVDWEGKHRIAWRRGNQFVHTQNDGPINTPNFISEEIRYKTWEGTKQIASIVVDDTPPLILDEISGTLGDYGWYRSVVNLGWTISDDESNILSTSGCDDQQVTNDTAGQSFTCQATSQGGTSSETVTIKVDQTPPTIMGSRFPLANSYSWNNESVTVQFSCDDALPGSGIVSCGPDQVISGAGTGQSVTGMAKDEAGNTATQTVGDINIDLAAPGITGTAVPAPNPAGWNNGDVTVSFLCLDDLSGVAFCSSDQVLSSEGDDLSVVGAATDKADNTSAVTIGGIKIDKTPPVVTINVPVNETEYVLGEIVNASWTVSDTLSGIETQQATTDNGVAIDTGSYGEKSFQVSATDQASNMTSVTHAYTVLTVAQATERFMDYVTGAELENGLSNSLTQKLESAIDSANRGNEDAASGQINAFINAVEAQQGKKIDLTTADRLISEARKILVALTIH